MTWEVVPTEDRASWLAARRQGIGASDIAAILGISPWTTPFQVWASKVAELPEDTDDEAMHWGSVLEAVILDEWGKANWPVEDRGLLLRSTVNPIFMATVDGMTDNGETGAPVEAKNVSDWRWDEPPAHHIAQVQWQLVVTGYPIGYLVALHGGRRMVTYEIEADPDYQETLTKAATEFWGYVEANDPPPTQWEDSTVMASLWPTSTEQAVEIAPDTALELYAAREARDAGKQRYEAAAASVKALLGEADTAVVGQQIVAKWTTDVRGIRTFTVKGDGLE